MSTQLCRCSKCGRENQSIAGYWMPDLEGQVKRPLCKDCLPKSCDEQRITCDDEEYVTIREYAVCPICGAEVPISQKRERGLHILPKHQRRESGGYQPFPTKGNPIPPKEE